MTGPAPSSPPPPEFAGPAGGPETPEAPQTTNGFAVASLVTGLLTPCGVVPGVASVILGVVALRQLRRRPQRGAQLAVGGFVATGGWLVVLALGTVVVTAVMLLGPTTPAAAPPASPTPTPAATAEPSPDPSPTPAAEAEDVAEAEQVSVFDLVEGYCIEDLWSDEGSFSVPVVPCAEPHDGQVYALFDLPDGDWPGGEVVEDDALNRCLDILIDDFPQASADEWLDVFALHPTRFTWRDGDREVICLTIYLDDQRTGSLFDDGDYPERVSDGTGA